MRISGVTPVYCQPRWHLVVAKRKRGDTRVAGVIWSARVRFGSGWKTLYGKSRDRGLKPTTWSPDLLWVAKTVVNNGRAAWVRRARLFPLPGGSGIPIPLSAFAPRGE